MGMNLAKHQGGYLSLSELTSLSDEDAAALGKHEERLFLNGLTSLSDAAAEALANHRWGYLSLNGLTSLSDAAAEALAKHRGYLSLNGLTSLSNTAAEALGKYEGYLVLYGQGSLSLSRDDSRYFAHVADYVPDGFFEGNPITPAEFHKVWSHAEYRYDEAEDAAQQAWEKAVADREAEFREDCYAEDDLD